MENCCGFTMALDILSFIGGVAAGALMGALAGTLYGLEATADLQERVRGITKQVEGIRKSLDAKNSIGSGGKLDELESELEAIQEEIRRMYRKTTH